MDRKCITSEILVAYSQCPRKAFLLLFSEERGTPHDYPLILKEHREQNRAGYLQQFQQKYPEAKDYSQRTFKKHKYLLAAELEAESLAVVCDVLTQVDAEESRRKVTYQPTIITGTYKVTKEQRTELLFVGVVLGKLQKQLPVAGRIVGMDGKSHRVKLEGKYRDVNRFLKIMQPWLEAEPTEPPALILNQHCQVCQFRQMCREQAEKEDNLSLLARMTPKILHKYKKRGILTVTQLSHLFKPQRRRKKERESPPPKHSFELQALALRNQKIYIKEPPSLQRQELELFLDIEGIPDQDFYYLIGLLICKQNACEQWSFWIDSPEEEIKIWLELKRKLSAHPSAPIYHYGNYEAKAFADFATRYESGTDLFKARLVNISSFIFGNTYFPTYSNGLKDIAKWIGFSWSNKKASGVQSIAWKYKHQNSDLPDFSKLIIEYNSEDCRALKKLVDLLIDFSSQDNKKFKFSFANEIEKFSTSEGSLIHKQFEVILQSAHSDYDKRKISFKNLESGNAKKEKLGTRHQTQRKIIPKPQKTIEIKRDTRCYRCNHYPLRKTQRTTERHIIDLAFIRNGIKKTITRYWGTQSYCPKCNAFCSPAGVREYKVSQIYGHGFQAWIVYHRVELRLPYRAIAKAIEEQFSESINLDTIIRSVGYVANFYKKTEEILITNLRSSKYVHVDETSINIGGYDWYVWVFTDGLNVVLKLTESRETTIVKEILGDFSGVLISDFYPGYDGIECQQQKCWAHLIRDLNNDLWKEPFDLDFCELVEKIRNTVVPIFKQIEESGSKARRLKKFQKSSDSLFRYLENKEYDSDLAKRYQKRLLRYRESLFVFINGNDLPWHNNTAENAIRHFTIQRTISGSFGASNTHGYLLLLGIRQSCRFQKKPFLRFLLSGLTNIDEFKVPRKKRNTRPVGAEIINSL